jgi:hypothetical protein
MLALFAALLGSTAGGCGDDRAASTAPALALPTPSPSSNPSDTVAARVAFELVLAEQRLAQELPLPDRLREQRCPDASLRELAQPDRSLVLVSRDARPDRRHVLPLRLRAPLAGKDLDQVRVHFRSGRGAPGERYSPQSDDPKSAHAALRELLQLKQRPLFGVYQITHYRAPRREHKPGHRKPKWREGELYAWLVVYDTRAEQPLCQTRIAVRNDTRNASLSIRLRSDTRNRLIAQLGQNLRERSRAALARISRVLELPAP